MTWVLFTLQRTMSSVSRLKLDDWYPNLGCLLEMTYWSIVNIENEKIIFDKNRTHSHFNSISKKGSNVIEAVHEPKRLYQSQIKIMMNRMSFI